MRKNSEPDPQEVLRWIERIAKYLFDQDRVPLIAGRVLGWLMICDPAEQTAGEIAAAVGASRASLTTNLRLLTSIGLVQPLTKPGQRAIHYRVDDEAWARVVQRQIASLASFGELTREGMALVGPRRARASRIRAANAVFTWMEKVFASAPPLPTPDPER